MSDMDELARAAQQTRLARGQASATDLCDYCRGVIDVRQPQYNVAGRVACARCYAHLAQPPQLVDVPPSTGYPPQPQYPPHYPPGPSFASPQQSVYVAPSSPTIIIQQAPAPPRRSRPVNALAAIGLGCLAMGLVFVLFPLGWLLMVLGFVFLIAGAVMDAGG